MFTSFISRLTENIYNANDSKNLQTMLSCVLLLLPFLTSYMLNAIKVGCNDLYQTRNGSYCYPCNPGYLKYSDCLHNYEQDRCVRCPAGEYQPNCDDSTKCIKCGLHCHPGEVKIQNCTGTSDIKCQCQDGTFEVPDDGKPGETTCKPHSSCKPGEGVFKKGTPYNDTICRPCDDGRTYSDKDSKDVCQPCSNCNTTFVKPCTPTSNSVCNDQAEIEQIPTETSSTHKGMTIAVSVSTSIFAVGLVAGIIGCLYWRKRRRTTNTDTEANKPKSSFSAAKYHKHPPEHNGKHSLTVKLEDSTTDKGGGDHDPVTSKPVQNGSTLDISEQERSPLQSKIKEEADNGNFVEKEKRANEMSPINVSSAGSNDNRDISMDAQAVPPRSSEWTTEDPSRPRSSEWPREGFTQTLGERTPVSESVELSVLTPTNNSTDVPFEGSDKNGTHTAAGGSPPSNRDIVDHEKVWMEVFQILSRNLAPDDFKLFYRWLTVNTNKDLAETRDVDIQRVLIENNLTWKETMYQLMSRWRQATHGSSMQQISDALKKAHFNQTHDKLSSVLEENGCSLRTQEFQSNRLLGSDVQLDNPQMDELKEHHNSQLSSRLN